MLRVAARKLSSLSSTPWRPNQVQALVSRHFINGGDSFSSGDPRSNSSAYSFSFGPNFHVPFRVMAIPRKDFLVFDTCCRYLLSWFRCYNCSWVSKLVDIRGMKDNGTCCTIRNSILIKFPLLPRVLKMLSEQ